jgi:hypothetical protein
LKGWEVETMTTKRIFTSLIVLTLAACGGKVGSPVTVQPDGGSGFDTGVGSGQCVQIELASFDQSCLADSDCVGIYVGEVCPDTCVGCAPNAAINSAGVDRYDSLTGTVQHTGTCGPCEAPPSPRCIANTCTQCPLGGGGPPGCSEVTVTIDGGIQTDDGGVTTFDGGGDDTSDSGTGGTDGGATCVTIEPGDYDELCTVSSDCTLIQTGELCDGSCDCGGSTPINVSGEPQYSQAISGIMLRACPCVPLASPACNAGVCVSCDGPNPPPACLTNHG